VLRNLTCFFSEGEEGVHVPDGVRREREWRRSGRGGAREGGERRMKERDRKERKELEGEEGGEERGGREERGGEGREERKERKEGGRDEVREEGGEGRRGGTYFELLLVTWNFVVLPGKEEERRGEEGEERRRGRRGEGWEGGRRGEGRGGREEGEGRKERREEGEEGSYFELLLVTWNFVGSFLLGLIKPWVMSPSPCSESWMEQGSY
jgi:hypothetical protein